MQQLSAGCPPSLSFWCCNLGPASAPALARLLGGDALLTLEISEHNPRDDIQMLDLPAAKLLTTALRSNSTLTCLSLKGVQLWQNHLAVAAELLNSLTAHKSLQKLDLSYNKNYINGSYQCEAGDFAAFAALGALVAANGPLQELNMYVCRLGDVGLRQLVDALPRNTHLRSLNIGFSDVGERSLCSRPAAARGGRQQLLVRIKRDGARARRPLGVPPRSAEMP
jgi:hypothetical protein